MTRLAEWLLGLERIRLDGSTPAALRLTTPPEPWVLWAGLLLAGTLVGLSYALESAGGRLRVLLAGCRLGAILSVMLLASRPALVVSRNHLDPSVVAVVVDRSASMATEDAGTPATPASRWDAAKAALIPPEGLHTKLFDQQRLQYWTFADSAEQVESDAPVTHIFGQPPAGLASDLPAALERVLAATRGSRLAAIVVVSDGRQTAATPPDPVLSELRERRVPLHAVMVGSARPWPDLAIERVTAEHDVFLRDAVEARCRVAIAHGAATQTATVELIDEASRQVLARQEFSIAGPRGVADVVLRAKPGRAGALRWTVRVAPLPGERNLANNVESLSIRAHDRKIRVLYVESAPRFEYRFLKSAIVRDDSIESSVLLLSAARDFPQEGTVPIRRFPETAAELAAYHVVILGDVDPRGTALTAEQWRLLTDFVGVRGGGLALIAGEQAAPHRFRQTALERALPIRIDPTFDGHYPRSLDKPFVPRLTPAGAESGLFPRPAQGDDAALPGWFWHARVLGPAAGALVLIEHPTDRTRDGAMPLATLGRFGAGRVYYQASDETWRWRRVGGESAYDGYWLAVVRLLGRSACLQGGTGWRLDVEPRQPRVGDPVRLTLRAADGLSRPLAPPPRIRLLDLLGDPVATLDAVESAASPPEYVALFSPRVAGRYTAQVEFGDDAERATDAEFEVADSRLETRDTAADFDYLRILAARSDGRAVEAADAARLADLIEDRSALLPDDLVEPLWDTPAAILLFLLPVSIEWFIRKWKGLA